MTRRNVTSKVLFGVSLCLALQGCKSRKFNATDTAVNSNDARDSAPFSPWDFTFQLHKEGGDPNVELPNITALLDKSTFDGAIEHMLVNSGVSADAHDQQMIDFGSGTRNRFSSMGLTDCLKDAKNWKVQTVRIAPYEMAFSGDIGKVNNDSATSRLYFRHPSAVVQLKVT